MGIIIGCIYCLKMAVILGVAVLESLHAVIMLYLALGLCMGKGGFYCANTASIESFDSA